MNEVRYKKGLPEIKWLNTVCSDIKHNKLVGGIETMEQKTPGSEKYDETANPAGQDEEDEEEIEDTK